MYGTERYEKNRETETALIIYSSLFLIIFFGFLLNILTNTSCLKYIRIIAMTIVLGIFVSTCIYNMIWDFRKYTICALFESFKNDTRLIIFGKGFNRLTEEGMYSFRRNGFMFLYRVFPHEIAQYKIAGDELKVVYKDGDSCVFDRSAVKIKTTFKIDHSVFVSYILYCEREEIARENWLLLKA